MQQRITGTQARTTSRYPRAVTFRGQLPGERVVLLTRASWWKIALPAWSLILSALALVGVALATHANLLSGPVMKPPLHDIGILTGMLDPLDPRRCVSLVVHGGRHYRASSAPQSPCPVSE